MQKIILQFVGLSVGLSFGVTTRAMTIQQLQLKYPFEQDNFKPLSKWYTNRAGVLLQSENFA